MPCYPPQSAYCLQVPYEGLTLNRFNTVVPPDRSSRRHLAEASIDSIGVFNGELRLEDNQQVNRGCSLRIKIDRQGEGKLSSLVRPAFRPDFAAVRLHDHFTDRQP
jgi:hypothetical protein